MGRIDPRKGIDKVINIFQQIQHLNLFELNIHGIHIPDDKEAVKIHNWLINQKKINYFKVEREKFSNKIDSMVVKVLRDTDIFIQPYKNLDSTVDTPLLIIESLACNCIVLSSKLPSVKNINGDSDYLIDYENFEEGQNPFKFNCKKINIERKEFSLKEMNYNAYESINVAKEFLSEIK